MRKLSQQELDELAEKAEAFASSNEGKRYFEEAFKKANELADDLAKSRIVRPEDMKRPMTI